MSVAKLPEGEAKDTLAAKNRNPEQTVRPSWTDMDALCAAMRRTKSRGEAAALLAHPLRLVGVHPGPGEGVNGDEVYEAARAVRGGEMVFADMRALAVKLREGVPAMRETGWYKTFYGPDSMDARGES